MSSSPTFFHYVNCKKDTLVNIAGAFLRQVVSLSNFKVLPFLLPDSHSGYAGNRGNQRLTNRA